jgi:two-component system chemotaxis sensor kinase CheA
MADSFDALVSRVDAVLAEAARAPEPARCRALLRLIASLLSEGTTIPDAAAVACEIAAAVRLRSSKVVHGATRVAAAWDAWKASRIAAGDAVRLSQDGPRVATESSAAESPVSVETNTLTPAPTRDDRPSWTDDPELTAMFAAEALDHLSTIEALVLRLEASPADRDLLNDVFRPFHTIKGNAGVLGFEDIQECAHGVEGLLDLARTGQHLIGPDEIELILQAVDVLTALVQAASGQNLFQTPYPLESRIALDTRIKSLVGGQSAGALVPQPGAVSRVTQSFEALQHPVKVDTRKLDSLVDIVGELVISQSMLRAHPALAGAVDERLARNLAQLTRITSDLQRTAMAMRMTPIRPTFRKMARLVRDLARQSGKQIELVMEGEDTELDRKVVENITDPLMHMVRNSVDHGIEPRAVRTAAGKPLLARISLRATHEGGAVVVAIADDGGGLATERIRAKAVAQGVIPADAELAPSEIHSLIFRPGFSTAETVSAISGRGVGMDVVRRNIEALRGRVEIQTSSGAGATFTIRVPLTLAILEGLLVRVGPERFVLPTFAVRESLRPTRGQVHDVHGRPHMIQVRTTLMPLLDLGELLGIGTEERPAEERTVVVIEDAGRSVGLVVDELLGKQEVVIKTLGEAFASVRGVAGGAILGDGRVGLILDAGGIVSLLDRPLARVA